MTTVRHMDVPAVVSAVLMSALRFTSIAVVAHDRDGRIIYANRKFYTLHNIGEEKHHVTEVVSEELWDIWSIEARIVLASGTPMRYIGEAGLTQEGQWITSRCASWNLSVERKGTMFTEVIPVSIRRNIVVRVRVSLPEILQYIPTDAELNGHDATLSDLL